MFIVRGLFLVPFGDLDLDLAPGAVVPFLIEWRLM
jgi:hypothetical protein